MTKGWFCYCQVLREMLGMQVTEEQLQSIAERAIQEADLDKDGAISFDEFRKVGPLELGSAFILLTVGHLNDEVSSLSYWRSG